MTDASVVVIPSSVAEGSVDVRYKDLTVEDRSVEIDWLKKNTRYPATSKGARRGKDGAGGFKAKYCVIREIDPSAQKKFVNRNGFVAKFVCWHCLENGFIHGASKVENMRDQHYGGKYHNKACDCAKAHDSEHFKIYQENKPFDGVDNVVAVERGQHTLRIKKWAKQEKELADWVICRWIVMDCHSFRTARQDLFKEVCLTLTFGAYDGPGVKAQQKYLALDVAAVRKAIKESLARAIDFHKGLPFLTLYIDGWTDSMSHHWIGVIVTYIDGPSFELKTASFGLYHLKGAHSGEEIAKLMKDTCFPEWGLKIELLHLTLSDNCMKESTAGKLLADASEAAWVAKVAAGSLSHPGAAGGDTCANHTLALVVNYAAGIKVHMKKKRICATTSNGSGHQLLAKSRKLAGHFNHSGKAVDALNVIQDELASRVPCAFPYDRNASQLYKA